MSVVLFVILWVITFPVAWLLLVKALVISSTREIIKYVGIVSLYIFVILLPYLPLILDEPIDGFGIIVIPIMIMSFVSAIGLILGEDRVKNRLWEFYANVYDGLLSFYPYVELMDDVVNECIEQSSDDNQVHILDLGCGTGNYANMLLEADDLDVGSITLVDKSKSMLDRASIKLKDSDVPVKLYNDDLISFTKEEVKNHTSKYDTVLMINSFYTLGNSEKQSQIHRVSKLLKQGGVLIIVDPDRPGSKQLIAHHVSNAGIISLIRPSLIFVWIVDYMISALSKSDSFNFTTQDDMKKLLMGVNNMYLIQRPVRTYGGRDSGICMMYTIMNRD